MRSSTACGCAQIRSRPTRIVRTPRLVTEWASTSRTMPPTTRFATRTSGIVMYGDYDDIGWNQIHDSVACSTRYGIIGHGIDLENGESNIFHDNRTWNNGSNFAELGSYVATNLASNSVFAYNISIGEGF